MTQKQKRTALVTGSSSGFGRAAVELFRAHGWNVVATTRQQNAWHDDTDRMVSTMDVRNPADVEETLARAVDRFGRLDCVVNNAGAGLLSVFESTPPSTVRELFEVNVFAVLETTRRAVPYLAANGGGRVVNVSSGAGIVPEPLMSVYSATKFAVEGFTESVRFELLRRDVTVKLVEPGLVRDTNFMQNTQEASLALPVPEDYATYVGHVIDGFRQESPYRLATSDEVAEAIVTAATDDGTRLRYLVGEDVEEPARIRREAGEHAYNEWSLQRNGVPA